MIFYYFIFQMCRYYGLIEWDSREDSPYKKFVYSMFIGIILFNCIYLLLVITKKTVTDQDTINKQVDKLAEFVNDNAKNNPTGTVVAKE